MCVCVFDIDLGEWRGKEEEGRDRVYLRGRWEESLRDVFGVNSAGECLSFAIFACDRCSFFLHFCFTLWQRFFMIGVRCTYKAYIYQIIMKQRICFFYKQINFFSSIQ